MEEHDSVPKRVYVPREDLEVFGSKRAVPGACRWSTGRRRDKSTKKTAENGLKRSWEAP